MKPRWLRSNDWSGRQRLVAGFAIGIVFFTVGYLLGFWPAEAIFYMPAGAGGLFGDRWRRFGDGE